MTRIPIGQKDGFSGERSVVLPPMAINMAKTDPLVKSLYITDIGYYPRATNHFRQRNEPIPQFVLIYCVNGTGFYEVNGTRYEVSGSQYFILPANEPHCYGSNSESPWTIYWVHFAGEHAEIYARGATFPQTVKAGAKSRISERNIIFEEILTTLQQGIECERLRYASSLLHHYLASMRYLALYRNAVNNVPADSSNGKMVTDAVIRFLSENIERHVSMEELSVYTGYSHGHLSQIFKKHTSHSITSFFNQLKMQMAAELIANTSMKINQICHKVGIDDSYYFTRLFKKVIGVSPTAYRANRRHADSQQLK